jgi:hypothetical protein
LKYLVIFALAALILVFVYRRVRPYIQAVQKFMSIASNVLHQEETTKRSAIAENKLVRCVACGTWIPSARAISAGSGVSRYCSTDCLEKPRKDERKISNIR